MEPSVNERPPLSTYEDLAKMIDHSLVRPELTDTEVQEGCRLALDYDVASVSVRPSDVDLAVRLLGGSSVKVGSVVGFPHGSTTTAVKLYEARDVIRRGAREIDMVLNIGKLRSRQFQFIETELGQMVETCQEHGVVLKVIFENCFLTEELKIVACRILNRVGANFAKTSTGFGPGGCTDPDLRLMRAHLRDTVGMKAAGGVRSLEAALHVYEMGCSRIGATRTATILDQWKAHLAEAAGRQASEPAEARG